MKPFKLECFLLVLFTIQTARSIQGARVAVIGGGIGGSSAAYYLRGELKQDLDIHLFERDRIGGRAQTLELDGRAIELGASIVHGQNLNIRNLADDLGLKKVPPGSGNAESLFSIHDGTDFVFHQSSWNFVTLYRMIQRYSLSYFLFQSAPKTMLARFLQIYKFQAKGVAFERPEQLLALIGLYNLTQHTMRQATKDILGAEPAAERFSRELVGGVNHINYNQDNSLNALAGMVSMLPTIDSSLFAVAGGNFQIAEEAIRAANATLIRQEVVQVAKTDKSYTLQLADGSSFGPYAAVILAAPLEQSNISFKGVPWPVVPEREYQTTVTTIVRGKLKAAFFNKTAVPEGEYIMVAEDANLPFSVIAPLSEYKNGTRLYKIFSSQVLDRTLASALFEPVHVIISQPWQAYPKFKPPEKFAPFVMAPGLFYNNALETAASAMEIAAIAGRNSALLTKHYLHKLVSTTTGISL